MVSYPRAHHSSSTSRTPGWFRSVKSACFGKFGALGAPVPSRRMCTTFEGIFALKSGPRHHVTRYVPPGHELSTERGRGPHMTTDVRQASSKLKKQKEKNTVGTCWAKIYPRRRRRNDSSTRRDFCSATDINGRNEHLRHGMSTGRAGKALGPTLSSQCSQHVRDMWLVRAKHQKHIWAFGRCCVEKKRKQ